MTTLTARITAHKNAIEGLYTAANTTTINRKLLAQLERELLKMESSTTS